MARKQTLFNRRKRRVRARVHQRANGRLRLSVFRSSKHIYAQVIDDAQGITLAHASSTEAEVRGKNVSGMAVAQLVGKLVAQRAKKAKVTEVVFDRGGYLYHGRVRALADAAREVGLKV